MKKKIKIPKGYSIKLVSYKNNTLILDLDKDIIKNGVVHRMVPTRVIQGL